MIGVSHFAINWDVPPTKPDLPDSSSPTSVFISAKKRPDNEHD